MKNSNIIATSLCMFLITTVSFCAEQQKRSIGQISRSSAGTAKTKQDSLEELWKLYSENFPLILVNLCENENEPDFLRKVRSKREIEYLKERYCQTYNEKKRSFLDLIYPEKNLTCGPT